MRYDPLFILFVVAAVVLCMTLHSLSLDHSHSGETGSELGAYLHAHDKKLLVLAAMLSVFASMSLLLSFLSVRKEFILDLEFLKSKVFSPLIL